MTFDYIINPESNRKVSIFSTKGRSILKNYLKVQSAGAKGDCKGKSEDECRPPECGWRASKEVSRKKKDGTTTHYERKAHCGHRPKGRKSSGESKARPRSDCAGLSEAECREKVDCNYSKGEKREFCAKRRARKHKEASSHCQGKSVDECESVEGCVVGHRKGKKHCRKQRVKKERSVSSHCQGKSVEECESLEGCTVGKNKYGRHCRKSTKGVRRGTAAERHLRSISVDSDDLSYEHQRHAEHRHHVGRPSLGGSRRYYY